MSTERKTSEVLDLAADVIEQRGWITGSWNNTRQGAPVCIEGGIAAALGIEVDLGGYGTTEDYEAFTACPAYQAVMSYLDLRAEDSDALWHWNDKYRHDGDEGARPARSKEQVVEVLRAAAAVERAKEESLEGSEVTQ